MENLTFLLIIFYFPGLQLHRREAIRNWLSNLKNMFLSLHRTHLKEGDWERMEPSWHGTTLPDSFYRSV